MSLYSREYWSESKDRFYMIEEVGDFQLVNGYRLLARRLAAGDNPTLPPGVDGLPNDANVLGMMKLELARRDLDPEWVGGLKPDDSRLNGREAKRQG